MSNQFLNTVTDADAKEWCVRPWCTTCGARDFRTAIAAIDNLQLALETIDLEKLTSHKDWCDALRVTAMDHRLPINWEHIISCWLPFAQNNIDFADHVFFYLASKAPRRSQTYHDWLHTCITLALKTKHTSLLESLVRILGYETSTHCDLLAAVQEKSSSSTLLKNALVKAGLTPLDDNLRCQKKHELAGKHLFGAIRRNDIKAVIALIAKKADLTVMDEDGRTPLEYAQSIPRPELVPLLESVVDQQCSSEDAPAARS